MYVYVCMHAIALARASIYAYVCLCGLCVHACVRACVLACVRACMRACMRACVFRAYIGMRLRIRGPRVREQIIKFFQCDEIFLAGGAHEELGE